MTDRKIPTATEVSDLLNSLFVREVSVKSMTAPPKFPGQAHVIATYADHDGQVVAACLCDLPAVAQLGAALTLVPPGRVDECVRTKEVDETLMGNFREVCNVMVVLFNDDEHSSLTLHDLQLASPPPANLPLDLNQPGGRLDLQIEIQGYGSGTLELMAA